MKSRILVVAATVACVALGANAAEDCVRASSFGWNAEDASACLEKALGSGAEKVIVDKQASDWIIDERLHDIAVTNMEIVIADGVTVRAKKGAFHDQGACLLRFVSAKDVTLRGEGNARLVMDKADYQDNTKYAWSEWRHAISFMGCDGVTIRDLEVRASGGDGIYVGHYKIPTRRVLLENVRFYDHHRQGISIISTVDFTARNCVFNTTAGTAPQCGIDVEPNRPYDEVRNVLFEDCTFNENAAAGILLYLEPLNGTTKPVSLTFRRCVANGNRGFGVKVNGTSACWLGKDQPGPVTGRILFDRCTGMGNGRGAIGLYNLVPGGVKVAFRDCDFDAGAAETPVLFGGEVARDFAGAIFKDTRVRTGKEPKIAFEPLPGTGAANCRGTLTFVKDGKEVPVDLEAWAAAQPRNPELLKFEMATFDYRAIKAKTPGKKLDKPVGTGFLDKEFIFVQCVPEAGEYRILVECARRVSNKDIRPFYNLRDMHGTDLGKFELKEGHNEVVLKANGPAVFRLNVNCGGGKAAVSSDIPGSGVVADAGVQQFWRGTDVRYFEVPANAEEVRVKVESGRVAAELLDASGRTVDSKPYDGRAVTLFAKRAKTAAPEFWGVRFKDNEWVNRFRVGAPALPIVSASVEAAIIRRRGNE